MVVAPVKSKDGAYMAISKILLAFKLAFIYVEGILQNTLSKTFETLYQDAL